MNACIQTSLFEQVSVQIVHVFSLYAKVLSSAALKPINDVIIAGVMVLRFGRLRY
jgi:hypothetical protein